jgi:predicted RNase H-like HicB family nuclease
MTRQYTYKLTEVLEPEEANVSSVHCPALPRCSSQGDKLEESLENIKEAILAMLKVGHTDGISIPRDTPDVVTERFDRYWQPILSLVCPLR